MQAHNPKNGEIWETKSGNIVLIVASLTRDFFSNDIRETTSFVWLDQIDKEYTSTIYADQLSHKLNMTIVEWATLMHKYAQQDLTPELPS